MFVDAGRDRKDIGIEDDVVGRDANLAGEQVICPLRDGDLALGCLRLALFVECHDHDRGAIAPAETRLFEKCVVALFQADGVDDRLALNTSEPGFDHRPFRRIDHDGHTRDIRLGRDQIQKCAHDLVGIEQPLIHVDVDDLRAVGDLLARNVEGSFERALFDQFAELGGARDVGALADVDEAAFAGFRLELFKTG